MKTEGLSKFCRRLPGSVHVTLHLAKSYRSYDFRSVLMKDCIVGILPTLMS